MSKWSEWKKSLGDARPWHLLDHAKHIEDENIVKQRMDTCLSCEHLISITKQCGLCGCFMPAKTLLANAGCPISKWNRVDIESNKE